MDQKIILGAEGIELITENNPIFADESGYMAIYVGGVGVLVKLHSVEVTN